MVGGGGHIKFQHVPFLTQYKGGTEDERGDRKEVMSHGLSGLCTLVSGT